jgi:hypothetical protein
MIMIYGVRNCDRLEEPNHHNLLNLSKGNLAFLKEKNWFLYLYLSEITVYHLLGKKK